MQDGFVYYLHNGSPLFCHKPEDRNSYRLYNSKYGRKSFMYSQ